MTVVGEIIEIHICMWGQEELLPLLVYIHTYNIYTIYLCVQYVPRPSTFKLYTSTNRPVKLTAPPFAAPTHSFNQCRIQSNSFHFRAVPRPAISQRVDSFRSRI